MSKDGSIWALKNVESTCKRRGVKKLGLYLLPLTRLNSKSIRLKHKTKTIKILGKNVMKFHEVGFGKDFAMIWFHIHRQ